MFACDNDFSRLYKLCEKNAHNAFLFKDKRLCIPKSSLCELLIREAHEGGLIGHFGVHKTVDILHEHFFWPKMKHDVNKYCAKCIVN